ncbi:hypothetical protein SAMN04488543_1612 [Friedmanniella luteola]|uniref:Uncharacterized protein n=1 Tax=Friedmanniella luteola TaxID=546871 RepID=A0A1H1RP55_9ACTN|nr:hypothetical protein SAMN04488543_1612 [Friedmanniella luteola]
MNTRRVPGLTRNSGWQAVHAEIVRARAQTQPQDSAPAREVVPRAEAGTHPLDTAG